MAAQACFESYPVAKPEDRFSRDEAEINLTARCTVMHLCINVFPYVCVWGGGGGAGIRLGI